MFTTFRMIFEVLHVQFTSSGKREFTIFYNNLEWVMAGECLPFNEDITTYCLSVGHMQVSQTLIEMKFGEKVATIDPLTCNESQLSTLV